MKTHDAVATKIGDYLSQNFLFSDQGFEYEDDASFLELGIIDSFGFLELLHWVEHEFSFPHGMAIASRARLMARALCESGVAVRVLTLQVPGPPSPAENTVVRGEYEGPT